MKYAAKRVMTLLMTMVVVSFLAFAAFDILSGDPATAKLGTEGSAEAIEALRESMGLNRPFLVRYADWLLGFFTGNLGESYQYHMPVSSLIGDKLLVTLCLSLMSFVIITAVSIPLGVISTRRPGGWQDGAWTAGNQLFMAIPSFFLGILLTWLFSIQLHWFVHGSFPGLRQNFWGSVYYLIFPAVAISIPRIATTVRMLRSTIVSEMQKDYVRTAISRGNDRGAVLWRHVLKNAMVPIVTLLAQGMAEILAGSIVVEQVFGVPGLGRLMVASIGNRDYPVVQALVVIMAFWVVLSGTVADLINQRIDPRLRLGDNA